MTRTGIFNEQLWCPEHGRLSIQMAQVYTKDDTGSVILPYYSVFCRLCGRAGALVCRGNLGDCNIKAGYCLVHLCHIGADPFPGGPEKTIRRLQELGVKGRSERMHEGDWGT